MIERFGDVVVRTQFQSFDLVHGLVSRGQHDHWGIREVPDCLQYFVAVNVRQADVQEYDIRSLGFDQFYCRLALAGTYDFDVAPLQLKRKGQGLNDLRSI